MILYHCTACGKWQDVSFLQELNKIFAPLAEAAAKMNNQPYEPSAQYPCPDGHGLMTQIQPHERIMLRPAEQGTQEERGYEQGYRRD